MFEYRQVLTRMRLGDTDRAIARAGLIPKRLGGGSPLTRASRYSSPYIDRECRTAKRRWHRGCSGTVYFPPEPSPGRSRQLIMAVGARRNRGQVFQESPSSAQESARHPHDAVRERPRVLGVRPEWGARQAPRSTCGQPGMRASSKAQASSRPTGGFAAEAGYGFGFGDPRVVLTAYAGMTLGEAGRRTVRNGVRWKLGSHVAVGLEATRARDSAGEAAGKMQLRAALRF